MRSCSCLSKMSDSNIETMLSDTVHETSRGDATTADADATTEIDNADRHYVPVAEKYDKTHVNDVHNTVQEHKSSDDTNGLTHNSQLKDSKDNVDCITKKITELNHRQSDESFSADPIDLVLQEIGEQNTVDESDERKDPKKLAFSAESNIAEDEREQDESCSNPVFRYKVIDTIFLFWNTTTMGWVYGQMGPALPDLQIIAGVPLQEATWLFTGFAIGYLGGCLLAGIIQDKFNPRLMLFLYTLGTAVTIGTLPWIPVFIGMVIIRVINGISIGGQDTGLHSMLFAIWAKDGGPFVQMTHVLSALGGIISPLITQPFVRKPTDITSTPETNDTYGKTNTTLIASLENITVSIVDTTSSKESLINDEIVGDTNVHYAFLITGILVFSAAVPFLVAFLQKRAIKKTTRQYSSESIDKNKLPKRVKQVILCILFANSFVATAYIDLFPSFLTTFLLSQLQWTQQSASTLTSVFFGMYAVGNFIGVFILAYITSSKLIAISYVTSGISITGILLSVMFVQKELIWVTVAVSGITMSGILPTLFTWTQEHVTPITARLASGLLISGSAGVMANPLLLGYMMDVYSPMWFIYLSLGETVLCAVLFTTAFILSRLYSAKRTKELEISALNKNAKPEIAVETTEGKIELYPRGSLYGV